MSKSYLRSAAVVFAIDLFAIIMQFYFAIVYWTDKGLSVLGSIGQFFSYYTIFANIAVCICLLAIFFSDNSKIRKIFLRKAVMTAVTVNIVFVGVAYNILLRGIYDPGGFQSFVNEILHTFIPVAFLIFNYSFKNSEALKWNSLFHWQLFPVIYAVYILIRGKFTGLYPYPFLDVGVYGYSQVSINILLLLTGFLIISLIFVFTARLIRVKKH